MTGFDPEWPRNRKESENLAAELMLPNSIRDPADHFSLYALDEMFQHVDFLDFEALGVSAAQIDRHALIPIAERYNLKRVLDRVTEHAEGQGVGVYFKNITHPWVGERELHCVKAITPGLFPMWFGLHNRRVAVTPCLGRLARQYTGRTVHCREDLNLEIHPFS